MVKKPISIANAAEFSTLVYALARDVVDAHIFWDQHKALQTQMEKWPEVQAEGSPFWYYTQLAHQRTALACLARVFDQQQSALHLSSWLISIRDHTHLFSKEAEPAWRPEEGLMHWRPEDVRLDLAQLENDIALCSNKDLDVFALMTYRHTQLAHRGAKLSKQDEAAKLPQLLFEQIERLLARAREILNRYNYLFDASQFAMTPLGHDAVERVFEGMQRDLDRHNAMVAAQFAEAENHLSFHAPNADLDDPG